MVEAHAMVAERWPTRDGDASRPSIGIAMEEKGGVEGRCRREV